MITYPIAFPSITGAARVTVIPHSVVGQSTSPFTGEQQTYAHDGQWWEHAVVLPPLFGEEGEQMVAFLLSLNGAAGTFTMRDLTNRGARGAVSGTPVVNGASQTGNTLNTSGWTPNITGQLLPGDLFQLGSGSTAHLHKVVSTASSDGSGLASIEIWPRLRGSPSNGASLITSSPVGVWRLSGDFQYTQVPGEEYEIQFTAREALDG